MGLRTDREHDELAEQQAHWEAERARFLAQTTDARELHAFAYLWNWDNGVEPLRAVIEHPCCDLGTAMMVFWLGEPEDALLGDLETDKDELQLLRAIDARMNAGGYATANIAFEPHVDWEEASQRPAAERLDARYYRPVTGA